MWRHVWRDCAARVWKPRTLLFITLSFRVYLIRIIASLLTLNSRCCATVQSRFFFFFNSANAYPQHGPLGCSSSHPNMNVTSSLPPPPFPAPSMLKGPSCAMGTSGPLQDERHTRVVWFSSVIIIADKCFLFVHPPACHPSTSAVPPSFAQGPDTEAERTERWSGECEKKKRRDKPGKNEIRWLFVSCRVGKKMPASRQVSCLVRSLSGAKRMKCVLWQRNRLWQPEMQTRGGLG